MSKLSICENNWINIVFEGKNKEYGAYQLRKESDKTTLLAFFMGSMIVTSLISISMLINLFSGNEKIKIETPDYTNTIIKLSDFKPQKPVKLVIPVAKKPSSNIKKEELINPTIVKPIDANQDIVKNNENSSKTNGTTGETTSNIDVVKTAGTEAETAPTIPENSINTTNSLDKLPEFPGGIGKFYNYVGTNFEKPELEEGKTNRIYVSFVIEKEGSMTDIQVKNNPGHGLDKEAIRVLKSLKTKWSPGMIKGNPVRTSYNLPIIVMRN